MNRKSYLTVIILGVGFVLPTLAKAYAITSKFNLVNACNTNCKTVKQKTEYFIIIGTFALEKNAAKLKNKAFEFIQEADYFFNEDKHTFYVYALRSFDRTKTLNTLIELRNYELFQSAWIYLDRHAINSESETISLASSPELTAIADDDPIPTLTSNTESSPIVEIATQINDSTATDMVEEAAPFAPEEELTDTTNSSEKVLTEAPTEVSENEFTQNKIEIDTLASTSEDNSIITDEVIEEPISSSKNDLLPEIADELPIEKIGEPASLPIQQVEEVQSAKSGEIVILNNLLFHRNAAILQASSKSDLDKLVNIMKVNKTLVIRIHGHTNGDFRGEIIKMSKHDKNYFQTSSRNDYVKGDAVLLSIERAKVIQNYLEKQGVSSGRVETRGWGGEKTIYSMESPNAALNSRVEIEIIQE